MVVDLQPSSGWDVHCIDRLSNDLLCVIFELVCEEDQATFQDKPSLTCWDDWKVDRFRLAQDRCHWARGRDHYYGREYHLPSVLISAMGVYFLPRRYCMS
ncbi:hypothetical protein K503DRAFT_770791 [Rhizopogon vinicolor AM-OR11-026]|uniref:Uncharacterized protein n=1 Tax=Rhizopogon vinicolor AM-OR11-026 TaxID=1314800 RepID=A0A1B7MZX8_9AGAM|nr:hypothetical protein K503DRAFT_770791 [Rhizopogon vinicolor AM-OR11-026]